jgi:hypothetical protein
VDVYLAGRGMDYVGKAKIVCATGESGSARKYDCRFVEKSGPWVLQ